MSMPMPPAPDFVLGLDLGPPRQFTALAVLERHWQPDPRQPAVSRPHFAVRLLQRWPLDAAYPRVAADLAQLLRQPPLDQHPLLALDQTGVGAPVAALFRRAGLPAVLRPVVVAGQHHAGPGTGGEWRVPRAELAAAVQVLLQERRLVVAVLPEREELVRELLTFRVRPAAAGDIDSWREQDRDDLVLAVALAAWLGERCGQPFPALPDLVQPRPVRSAAARRGLFGLRG